MDNTKRILKAKLIELNPDFTEKSGGKVTEVQFNPESLKVSFANQIAQPQNSGSSAPSAPTSVPRQFVGAGTTKLALTLWFDVSSQDASSGKAAADVRDLTKNVAYFITPKQEGEQFVPPIARFLWGSFMFDGMVDSLEETLEFFSDEGVPLRANVSLNMSQQRIQEFTGNKKALSAAKPPPGAPSAGTQPFVQIQAGVSLQAAVGASASAGASASWQSVAEANGIENPRMMSAGTMINLQAGK